MVSAAQNNLTNANILPAQVNSQISYAVLGKTLEAARQEGNSLIQLINNATATGPQAGDPLVAKATGIGGLIDTLG